MPHRIINKLQALERMSFASLVDTPQPYLTHARAEQVPDEALDLIDGVIDDCLRIFGARTRPNQQQIRIMAEGGFVMTFDGPTIGVKWQATVIHTEKGLIEIR